MQALSTVASAARLVPGFLVVDFDGTCTVKETIGLLPRLAAHLGQESAAAAKLARFKELEEEYIAGIRHVNARHDLDGPPPASLDLVGLERCLAEQDAHSTEVTNRVGESGVLAGISPSAVAPTLAEWAANPAAPPIAELRHGCASTLGSASAAGSRLGVLSINWSPPLIRATLSPLAAPLELWCNELQPDGSIVLPVPGAAAKRARIAALVDAVCARPVVYVGDSPTDLLAMLEADVGVLIGESASARLIARRFGVRIAPLPPSLRECLAARGAQEGEVAAAADSPGVVWEAGSWEEIRRCLLGELQDPI